VSEEGSAWWMFQTALVNAMWKDTSSTTRGKQGLKTKVGDRGAKSACIYLLIGNDVDHSSLLITGAAGRCM